ncbi:hypothetical protein HK098_001366 [Nowakowskiella sp. JEL0407]|nr:hypothetical protein HK098_001366 [Nowakowskiella sp. JEL0407]
MNTDQNNQHHIYNYKLRLHKLNELYDSFNDVDPDTYETVATALPNYDWITFGFHCIAKRDALILPFLINTRRVPTLARNKNGSTFLHVAIALNNYSIAESLSQKFTEFIIMLKCINKSGKTPLDIAVNQQFYSSFKLLLCLELRFIDKRMREIIKRAMKKADDYCRERRRKSLVWIIFRSRSIANTVAMGAASDSDFYEKYADFAMDEHSAFYDSIELFYTLVIIRWDGKISSFADSLITEDNQTKFNKLITAFKEESSAVRLNVLKYMASFYETEGPVVIPRVDVLVHFKVDDRIPSVGSGISNELRSHTPESNEPVDEDKRCAICFEEYYFPQTLSCKHKFCLDCLLFAMSNQVRNEDEEAEGIRCSYCRQIVRVPFAMVVVTELQSVIAQRFQWLKTPLISNLGEALLGLAAGTDSVVVLAYLVEIGINPEKKTSIACVKWLCVNGFSGLVNLSSDDGETPIDVVLKNWIEGALKAKSSTIVSLAVNEQKCIESKRFIELLPAADIDQLVERFLKSSLVDRREKLSYVDHFIPFAYLIENVLKFNRIDFATKFFSGELGVDFRDPHIYEFTRKEALKYGNLDRLESFLIDGELAREIEKKIEQLYFQFPKSIEDGYSVETVNSIIQQQDNLMLERSKIPVPHNNHLKIVFTDQLFGDACYKGHVHLVDVMGDLNLMVFGLNKIKQSNQPIPVVDEGRTYLRVVVDRNFLEISYHITKGDELDANRVEKKSQYAWKEMIDYLLKNNIEDPNAPSDSQGRNVLWCFDTISLGKVENLEPFLDLMKTLVGHGVNPNQIFEGSTIVDVLLRNCRYAYGNPMANLRLIEWLALESNVFVDIQFMELSSVAEDKKVVNQEFARIKLEQKKRFGL